MALIKCPECGKEISDKAGKCPYCGYPIEEIENNVEKETGKQEVLDGNKETPKKKKSLNKKVIITISAIIGAAVIGAGVYMVTTADSRTYNQAKQLYEESDYKAALEKFKKIEDYKNSKELIQKCEYNLSPDGQFLITFVEGLEERWDYSDKGDTTLNEKDSLEKSATIELEKLEKLDTNFKDEQISNFYQEYVKALNESIDALQYYTLDYNNYSIKWDEIYKKRSVLIRDIFNAYDLKVGEKYQKTLDEFISNASIVDGEIKLKQQINDMTKGFSLEHETDEYGYTKYKIKMANTTEYVFDHFWSEMNILNADGKIIATSTVSEVNQWEIGQEAEVEVYLSQEIDPSTISSIVYTPHYKTGNYYSIDY